VTTSVAAPLAFPPFDEDGARTAAAPRTVAPTDGVAGSRDRASRSVTSRARSPTVNGACARSTPGTPHGRDPKAATMSRH